MEATPISVKPPSPPPPPPPHPHLTAAVPLSAVEPPPSPPQAVAAAPEGPEAVLADFSRGSGPSVSGGAAGSVSGSGRSQAEGGARKKPLFRLAADDTKPVLRDPISHSDPMETEQAVLRLPPFP